MVADLRPLLIFTINKPTAVSKSERANDPFTTPSSFFLLVTSVTEMISEVSVKLITSIDKPENRGLSLNIFVNSFIF